MRKIKEDMNSKSKKEEAINLMNCKELRPLERTGK